MKLNIRVILQVKKSSKRATLNVGGIKHEVMWKMLEQVTKLDGISNYSCGRAFKIDSFNLQEFNYLL